MWVLENEGEALDRESRCLFFLQTLRLPIVFLLAIVEANRFHYVSQVNEYGFAPENAIFSVAPSPSVRRDLRHADLEQVVSSADCLLAGQLAIHGPGAEKVSRKHVTIAVDKVEEGQAVRPVLPIRLPTLTASPPPAVR